MGPDITLVKTDITLERADTTLERAVITLMETDTRPSRGLISPSERVDTTMAMAIESHDITLEQGQ